MTDKLTRVRKGDAIFAQDEADEPNPEDFGEHVAALKQEALEKFKLNDVEDPEEPTIPYERDFHLYPKYKNPRRADGTYYEEQWFEAVREAEAIYSPIIEVEVSSVDWGPPILFELPIEEDRVLDHIDCPFNIVDYRIIKRDDDTDFPASSRELQPRRPDWSPVEYDSVDVEYIVVPRIE